MSRSGAEPPKEKIPVKVYRCRLFRVAPPSTIDRHGTYTEVWDTLDDPYEERFIEEVVCQTGVFLDGTYAPRLTRTRCTLPDGDLMGETQNTRIEVIRQRIDVHRQRAGIVTCGYRGHKGS